MHVLNGENPVKGIELPRADDKGPEFLSKAEIKRLLGNAEDHSRD